jgi:hypothetical protein
MCGVRRMLPPPDRQADPLRISKPHAPGICGMWTTQSTEGMMFALRPNPP